MIGYNQERNVYEFPLKKGGLRFYFGFCLVVMIALTGMFSYLLVQEALKYQYATPGSFVVFSPAWATLYVIGLLFSLIYFGKKVKQSYRDLRVGKLLLHPKYLILPDRAISVSKIKEVVYCAKVQRKFLFTTKVYPESRMALVGENDKVLGVIFVEDFLYLHKEDKKLYPIQSHDVERAIKHLYPELEWSACFEVEI